MANCYSCKHRGTVLGSAHSRCNIIPKEDQLTVALAYLKGYRLNLKVPGEPQIPALKLDPDGVQNGWALWPADFDPVWVSECKFYQLQQEQAEEIKS